MEKNENQVVLSDEEVTLLQRFSLASEAPVIKKIVKHYLKDLESILNVDPKGNMGLQTLARQEAYKYLIEIFDKIFQEPVIPGRQKPKEALSQWR